MRENLNMNQGWKFHVGDIEKDLIRGHYDTYMHSKAQSGLGAAATLFYDGDFQMVDLPHDYVLDGKAAKEYNESQGAYLREDAWYRKNFQLSEEDRGRRIVLLFDGAGMKTKVWINGHTAGQNDSMYNSFFVDITPYLVYGKDINTVAVHIVNDDLEGWWYEGAGIYRNVWMIKTDAIAVDVWGAWVNPVKKNADQWEVKIETTIHNIKDDKKILIEQAILDDQGMKVEETSYEMKVTFGQNRIETTMLVEKPVLWDLQNSRLYRLLTRIKDNNRILDEYETSFGFREIDFDAKKGFYLNGKHVKLRGACMHQDHGNLGVALPKSVMEYRIQKLKEAGMNAYRCAHHNPAPEILEICDRLGMLVVDENRWFNFSDTTKKQLKSMCLRDRNHPCVIMWSIGNEEPLQNTLVGKELTSQMRRFMHKLDGTRPVTIALNGGFYDSYAAEESDVIGVNYLVSHYDQMHLVHSEKAIVATESGASANTRGIYFLEDNQEQGGHYETAYDKKRVEFGSSYAYAIEASETHEYISGTFLWAGMEYRGEAIWPILFSGTGILDSCAMEKDNFYLVKSFWGNEPMIHMVPQHWNFETRRGEMIQIHIYSNVNEVELYVNNRSLGIKKVEPFHPPVFEVPYEPGSIRAIGIKDGRECVEQEIYTVKEPVDLRLDVKNCISNSGEDAVVVEASLVDERGQFVPCASQRVFFTSEEQGEILAVSGGDPKDHEPAKAHDKKMFNGRVQAIIKVKEGSVNLRIGAAVPELGLEQSVLISPVQAEPVLRVQRCDSILEIKEFRIWPETMDETSLDSIYDFNDMNTSQPVTMKNYRGQPGRGYDIYTGKTIIPKFPHGKTVYMKFNGISGNVKVKVFHDTNCWPNPTPKEFKKVYAATKEKEKRDLSICLDGFGSNEKCYIVIMVKRDGLFELDSVEFALE